MDRIKLPKVNISDPDQLQSWYSSLYPRGSGPLSVMRMACSLIEAIAAEKGITLVRPNEEK